MKKIKITYWVATTLIGLAMALSAYMYLTAAEIKTGFAHLGFPDYFRVELAVAKLIGAMVLLIPNFKGRIKEWAYSGFVITFVSAFIAHIASGDAAGKFMAPLIMLSILMVSYFSWRKLGH